MPRGKRSKKMEFMMLVKATAESEAGQMPSEEMILEMTRYNEQLEKAGVLRGLNGLQSSAKGFRVAYKGGEKAIVDGPFSEVKELIAGYWIIEVGSKQEAMDWALKIPHPHPGSDTHIEVRQIFGLDDFPSVPE